MKRLKTTLEVSAAALLFFGFQSHASSTKNWPGTYVGPSEKILVIRIVHQDQISVDIVPKGQAMDSALGSHFMAKLKGNSAQSEIQKTPECIINFIMKRDMVILHDHCGGNESGEYRRRSKSAP
jgi:hypothetical protein